MDHQRDDGRRIFGEVPAPQEITDIGDLIIAASGSRYQSFARGRLLTVAPPDAEIVPVATLLLPDKFKALIDRGARHFPKNTDRRALSSYWSQFYLSTALIGAALCWLTTRRTLSFGIERTSVVIDKATTAPQAFLLPDLGELAKDETLAAAMLPLIRDHIDPLLAAIAREAKLSRRVLWTNAASYLAWIVEEAGQHFKDEAGADAGRLLANSHWHDGQKNHMHATIRFGVDANGNGLGYRRTCCLRYRIPGVAGCGQTCPLEEGSCTA